MVSEAGTLVNDTKETPSRPKGRALWLADMNAVLRPKAGSGAEHTRTPQRHHSPATRSKAQDKSPRPPSTPTCTPYSCAAKDVACFKCGKRGHVKRDCPVQGLVEGGTAVGCDAPRPRAERPWP